MQNTTSGPSSMTRITPHPISHVRTNLVCVRCVIDTCLTLMLVISTHHPTTIAPYTHAHMWPKKGDHGLLLRIGAPMEDGSGAIRLDVGGLFPAMDGSSRRRSGAVWSQVYDAAGGNLREAALFESSSSEV